MATPVLRIGRMLGKCSVVSEPETPTQTTEIGIYLSNDKLVLIEGPKFAAQLKGVGLVVACVTALGWLLTKIIELDLPDWLFLIGAGIIAISHFASAAVTVDLDRFPDDEKLQSLDRKGLVHRFNPALNGSIVGGQDDGRKKIVLRMKSKELKWLLNPSKRQWKKIRAALPQLEQTEMKQST